MCFFRIAMPVIVADAILVQAAPVIHAMDEMMFMKKDKRAENDRLVYALQFVFKRGQAERVAHPADGSVDEQAC